MPAFARLRPEQTAAVNLGQDLGQLRASPVCLGVGEVDAIFIAYAADFDVDPYIKMFFFPSDTLKLALLTIDGEILDRLGRPAGRVPGRVALARKLGRWPGEQILVYSPEGEIAILRDAAAEDSAEAKARYANPYYRTARQGGVLLGGL